MGSPDCFYYSYKYFIYRFTCIYNNSTVLIILRWDELLKKSFHRLLRVQEVTTKILSAIMLAKKSV